MVKNDNPQRVRRILRKAKDSDVGYGKPPKAHQFKPGQSGNPKGRPKGAKSKATILRELVDKKVTIRENGKLRKITVLECIFRKVIEDCLKGNIKSVIFLLSQLASIAATEGSEAGISIDDEAVLDAYLQDYLSMHGSKA